MRLSAFARFSGHFLVAIFCLAISHGSLAGDEPDKSLTEKTKEIAGTAEFLRSVPKRFAILKAHDPARRRVTVLIDGENLAKEWELASDAEIKCAGWWGRLDQLTAGDRVWLWFQTNRQQQPIAISMLADELSEQDMHGLGVAVESRSADTLTLKPVVGKSRTVALGGAEFWRGQTKESLDNVKAGERVFVQSTANGARLIVDAAGLEARRAGQQAALRKRWESEGLPGTVIFVHRFSGEMDFMLDHEAMRWGRSLKTGDAVTFPADPPIKALVKKVQPWRERTQLRLVVSAADLADLSPGQRCRLQMIPPALEVDRAILPTDIDWKRTRDERIDWFLASIYCTCQ